MCTCIQLQQLALIFTDLQQTNKPLTSLLLAASPHLPLRLHDAPTVWFWLHQAGTNTGHVHWSRCQHMSPQMCPFLWGYLDPHLIHSSTGQHKSAPNRHLDWFSHFCTANHVLNTQVTVHATSVQISCSLHLCTACR